MQLEGRDRSRNVVVEFPSLEVAQACYNSELYQKAVGFSSQSSVRDVVLVEGVD